MLVLYMFDLMIVLGEKVGFVGFFGVGKFIVVFLLLWLCDVSSGCIFVDG